jgi:hypothetical protein
LKHREAQRQKGVRAFSYQRFCRESQERASVWTRRKKMHVDERAHEKSEDMAVYNKMNIVLINQGIGQFKACMKKLCETQLDEINFPLYINILKD